MHLERTERKFKTTSEQKGIWKWRPRWRRWWILLIDWECWQLVGKEKSQSQEGTCKESFSCYYQFRWLSDVAFSPFAVMEMKTKGRYGNLWKRLTRTILTSISNCYDLRKIKFQKKKQQINKPYYLSSYSLFLYIIVWLFSQTMLFYSWLLSDFSLKFLLPTFFSSFPKLLTLY